MTFVQARLQELPPCLDGPQGQGIVSALGTAQDDEQILLTKSILLRYPARLPDDALDIFGTDSSIERFDGEPNGTAIPPTGYRGRLIARWDTWKKAGSAQAIIDSLNAWGLPHVQIAQDFEGHYFQGTMYSRFEVIIRTYPGIDPLYFRPLSAPFTPDASGTITGGSTATIFQVRAIKKQVLKWKAAHSYPVRVIIAFDDVILGNINSTPPFTPPDPSQACLWNLGKLVSENITTAPFTPGGYDV